MKINWANLRRDLCFNGVTEIYFLKTNWEKFGPYDSPKRVSILYLIFRLVFMVIFFGTVWIGLCTGYSDRHFFLYLTNQSYALQVLYSIIYFSYVAWMFFKERKASRAAVGTTRTTVSLGGDSVNPPVASQLEDHLVDKPPVICKILWLLLTIIQVTPYFVFVGYWFVVAKEIQLKNLCQEINNFFVHAVNAIGALVDTFIIAIPSRPIHCIFVTFYAFAYCLFTYLFEIWDGKYPVPHDAPPNSSQHIYGVLDWKNKPGKAVIASAAGTLVCPFAYFLFSYGFYRLKLVFRRMYLKEGAGQVGQVQPGQSKQVGPDEANVADSVGLAEAGPPTDAQGTDEAKSTANIT